MSKRMKWTKNQLDILYECWKGADSNRERINLIEEKLPAIPPLVALSKMRLLASNDSKWISMATRKKNQKDKDKQKIENEKEQKRKERERVKEERLKRKLEREEKKLEREKIKEKRSIKDEIKDNLKLLDFDSIKEKIDNKVFFCNKTQQFMDNLICIFRIHSKEYGFTIGGPCEKCNKMDEYIPKIQEVINARQEEIKRNKASKGGGENKKKPTSHGERTNGKKK